MIKESPKMTAVRLAPARRPGTVLVAFVETDEGRAPFALVAERVPSTKTYRVVSPSGKWRTIERRDARLEDLDAAKWKTAVDVALRREVVAMDAALLGGDAGAGLIDLLRTAGAAVPTAEQLEKRRTARLEEARAITSGLGFVVV